VVGGPAMSEKPLYDSVQDIIIDLWEYCMELELEYYETRNKAILQEFALCIGLIQYWEDILLAQEGYDVFHYYT